MTTITEEVADGAGQLDGDKGHLLAFRHRHVRPNPPWMRGHCCAAVRRSSSWPRRTPDEKDMFFFPFLFGVQ